MAKAMAASGCGCSLTQVDLAVIETGLGGARDATNVFTAEQLQVAIFTAIALEHSAALGVTTALMLRHQAAELRIRHLAES